MIRSFGNKSTDDFHHGRRTAQLRKVATTIRAPALRKLDIPIQRVNELIRAKRGITPGTAWLLSKALGTSPEFWMNLQVAYELSSIDPPKSSTSS